MVVSAISLFVSSVVPCADASAAAVAKRARMSSRVSAVSSLISDAIRTRLGDVLRVICQKFCAIHTNDNSCRSSPARCRCHDGVLKRASLLACRKGVALCFEATLEPR
eukprot:964725-Amphidinium_carterae.1